MTNHEFALSDLAARLAGTDATLTTAIRDILAAALQELIEARTPSPRLYQMRRAIPANGGTRVDQNPATGPNFLHDPLQFGGVALR
jgi:hypothetical protein